MALNAHPLAVVFGRGLPARAILSVVVVALLVPALAVAGWLASVSADAERAQIEQNVQQRAHEISAILDREIAGVKSMLIALATSSALPNGDLQEFHAKATEISQQLDLQIILYDVKSNRHVLNTHVPFGTPLEAYSFPRALVDRVVAAKGPFVTGVQHGPLIKRHAVGVIIPIRPTEQSQYLLSAAILASRIANIFDLVQMRAPYVATIVDRNGVIVARSSKHDQFVGQPIPERRVKPDDLNAHGVLAGPNAEGVSFRWFYQKSAVSDWIVLVGVPEEVFGTSFRFAAKLLAGAAVLLFAVGLTLAYRVGGGFSRAVSELGTVARDLPHQPPPQRMVSNIREANNLLDDLKIASADLRATDWQQRFAIDAAEIGTWSWDIIQNRQIWSRRTRELYQLPADRHPSATHVFASIHPDDLEKVRANVQRCLAGQNSYEIEFRIRQTGGSYRWINGKGRVERDAAGTAVFMHGALQDITERKQIESDRAELRRRLMHAQEEERLRLAHELHDQTGQSLTAALLEVKQIGAIASHQGSVHLRRLRDQLEDMGKTVHRIACELRPTAIEDLGLRAALANYLSDWSAKYGIAADFHFDGENEEETARLLSDEVQTAIYRIAQEGLTNIVKHAEGVTTVSIVVSCTGSLIQLTLEDNGCGFDTTARIDRAGHSGLGLAGMRERAALVGGTLEVESSRQAGTTVFVRIPIEQRRQVA